MSDITAVVLSIGEETTARAIESVRRQALPVKDIVTIRNVVPFYKAFNLGASRVKTEFFVQVDSDMVLDENCLQELRACVTEDVGMVLGSLRDPLMTRVGWIKLFRTKLFEQVQYQDLICNDLVFTYDISKQGWNIVFALRPLSDAPREIWHTFGEHRPSYTPLYTYSKYLLEGRKYRYRKAPAALTWHQRRLAKSSHPAALIARIALAHGLFIREQTDLLRPYLPNKEFDFLQRFLMTSNSADFIYPRIVPWICFSAKRIFQESYQLGITCRQAHEFPGFKRCLDVLDTSRDPLAWIAKVGLCHGLFSDKYHPRSCAEDYKLLEDLLGEYSFRWIVKAKLKCFVLALLRFIKSTCTFGFFRSRFQRSFRSVKLWLLPRAPSSG